MIPNTVARQRPVALAHLLGREERLEDAIQGRTCHPHTRVADGQKHVRSGRDARVQRHERLIEADVFGGHRERSALGHGITRVHGQIHQHLLELSRVDQDTSVAWATGSSEVLRLRRSRA